MGKVKRSVMSVRTFPRYLLNHLSCMCMGHDHSSPETASQRHRPRQKTCVLREYTLPGFMSIDRRL